MAFKAWVFSRGKTAALFLNVRSAIGVYSVLFKRLIGRPIRVYFLTAKHLFLAEKPNLWIWFMGVQVAVNSN